MGIHALKFIDQPDEALRERVVCELRDYNRSKNALFFELRELPEHAPRPLNIIAYDEAGEPIGGLFGETQFTWLKISILVVHRSHRGQGLGQKLMAAAEREGVDRKCKYAFLDTMDYQAPAFYQKLGYEIAGALKDWDSQGHTKYFLVKSLGNVNT